MHLSRSRRAATGLFFLIDNFVHISMLQHDALAGLHTVDASIEDAGDEYVWSGSPGIVDAGVTALAKPNLDV